MNELLRRLGAAVAVIGLTISTALPAAAAQAHGPLPPGSPPPWPAEFVESPPQIPEMPTAGEVPPSEVITDPITPGATCGSWQLSNLYGGHWPAASTWWEYQCTFTIDENYYFPSPCGIQCDAGWTCWGYPYNCYSLFELRVDHFVWDGTSAAPIFYGQAYTIVLDNGGGPGFSDDLFWNAPTQRWHTLVPRHLLTLTKTGSGSGTVTAFPAGINCGDICQASFPAGTEIILGAPPDVTSVFAGWSGGCAGTSLSCQLWMNGDRSVTATFRAANTPPTAAFAASCLDLSCSFDAGSNRAPNGATERRRRCRRGQCMTASTRCVAAGLRPPSTCRIVLRSERLGRPSGSGDDVELVALGVGRCAP